MQYCRSGTPFSIAAYDDLTEGICPILAARTSIWLVVSPDEPEDFVKCKASNPVPFSRGQGSSLRQFDKVECLLRCVLRFR